MGILMIIQFIAIGALLWYIKAADDRAFALKETKIDMSETFLRTVAMGLAHRFHFPEQTEEETEHESSTLFLEHTKSDFIDFATQIIRHIDGGTVYLTNKAQHDRTHFEIERADGMYVGMAIVSETDIHYEPVALLHSHLIQQQAQGGYIITTSDFTDHAKRYTSALEIELINGRQLAAYWIQTMEEKRYEEPGESPSTRSG